MQDYDKQSYILKFGRKMWEEKVESVNEGAEVDKVYATDNGNIFMIMNKEEA